MGYSRRNAISLVQAILCVCLVTATVLVSAPQAGAITKVIAITSSGQWTVPPDWNPNDNTIEAIGAGGKGGQGTTVGGTPGGGGGGGGAYAKIINWSGSGTISVTVGQGGSGTDTVFADTSTLVAKAGQNGNHNGTGGSGGSASLCVGSTVYSGGAGSTRNTSGSPIVQGGGGGGAAGPHGAGNSVAVNTPAGGSGDTGLGGAGGSAGLPGGSGGAGTEWSLTSGGTAGAGGGGGAAQGAGGSFGAGGAGGSYNGQVGGNGGAGLIIITYSTTQTVATPTFSPTAGDYATPQSVTISCSTPGASIYYTTDGSTPTSSSTLYSGVPITVDRTMTINAIACLSGYTDSNVASGTYNMICTAPTFDPSSGQYSVPFNVTISTATPGGVIYYTTDGTDPTTSSAQYTGAIQVNGPTTIKAITAEDGWTTSAETMSNYNQPVATPTFSPDGGIFNNDQSVTISSATSGATIYYTVDGSDPTTGSTQYTGPVPVSASETIKAIAVETGWSDSSVGVSQPYNMVCADPTFTPSPGTYSVSQNVTITTATTGATIYYTTDGTEPTTGSSLYTGPVTVNSSMTLEAIAVRAGWATSAPASVGTYSISATGQKVLFLTSSQQWLVPSDWNNADNKIEAIGMGGRGGSSSGGIGGGGGGGGAYAIALNQSLSGTINVVVGTPSSPADTQFGDKVIAKAGSNGTTTSGGAGGSAGDCIPVAGAYSGGNGNWPNTTPGGGGGGAAGLNGAGGDGGSVSATTGGNGDNNLGGAGGTYQGTITGGAGTEWTSTSGDIAGSGGGGAGATGGNGNAGGSYGGGGGAGGGGGTGGVGGNGGSGLIVITYTPLEAVATPVLSLATGTYSIPQSVTISCSTPGASIYYTTDGSTPTSSSTLYTGDPIPVDYTMTLNVIACESGYGNSDVASAVYTMTCGTPAFDPPSGVYTLPVSVALSTVTPGATIYYTTDGTNPTTNSTPYATAIQVTVPTTIKAIAAENGWNTSAQASSHYNVSAATPTFYPNGGSYNIAQTVSIDCATPGVAIHYTMDGSTPTSSSTLYNGPIAVNRTMTLKAVAVAGSYVDSSVASATYNMVCATPAFVPPTGVYDLPVSVDIIDYPTAGSTIYYTTDGSDPTTSSTRYTGTIQVTATTTIKAIAAEDGWTTSAEGTGNYNLVVANPTFSPAAGTYYEYQTVSITTSTSDATIYYTVDGSAPSTASCLYTGPINVGKSQTIRVKAFKKGFTDSEEVDAQYVMKVTTPTFSPGAGAYTYGQRITISTPTPLSKIYYTTDGTTPTVSSTQYTQPVEITQDCTLQAIAVRTGWADSDPASAVMTLQSSSPVATPQFSPDGGTYNYPQYVKITCATPGAIIRYTDDGTDPGPTSTAYDTGEDGSGVVVVSHALTLKACAYDTNGDASAIYTAVYADQSSSGGGGSTNPPSYSYEVCDGSTPAAAPTVNITDIYQPNTVRLDFNNPNSQATYDVERVEDGVASFLSTTGQNYWVDTAAPVVSGYTYQYMVRVDSAPSDPGLPPVPSGHDPNASDVLHYYTITPSAWTTVSLTPVIVNACENQAVDSRLDQRYADNRLMNFQFSNQTYRGGLFAGYNNDPAKVGRSFLKYDLTELDPYQANCIWTASANFFNTMSASAGNTSVGCYYVDDDSWEASNMVWSTAPAIDQSQLLGTMIATSDGKTLTNQWLHVPVANALCYDYAFDEWGWLSLGLASEQEGVSGWAYFAKKEYDPSLDSQLIVGYGASAKTVELYLDSNTVKGGTTVGGTIILNGCPSSATVQMSTDSKYAEVQQECTAVNGVGRFVVSTHLLDTQESGSVTATISSCGQSAVLTITH